jgi:hypothetical protein
MIGAIKQAGEAGAVALLLIGGSLAGTAARADDTRTTGSLIPTPTKAGCSAGQGDTA